MLSVSQRMITSVSLKRVLKVYVFLVVLSINKELFIKVI